MKSVSSSNVTVYQLESLTRLAKQVQRVGFCHVHHVGNLIPSSPLDVLGQSGQVNRE